ncbi:MAG: polymer-forming cytoskeletal protein [Sideroxydans sp.]|nr:polymer-forming cytoskeletal protein [Sideroxydans sp.]
MFSKNNKPQNRIDSLIGLGTKVKGDVFFTGGLRVDGEITGNVVADQAKASTLVLSEHARVDGEIKVTHLVVNGVVNGPILASEYMELQSKAKVTGDVKYKTMEIQLGAMVEGKLMHISEVSEKVVSLKLSGTESK